MTSLDAAPRPIHPASLVIAGEAARGWPVPLLDVPFKVFGLRPIQWCYVFIAYLLWDVAPGWLAPLGVSYPWQARVAWGMVCVTLGVLGIYVTWHGLHLLRALSLVLASAAEPPLALWRPLDDGIEGE